jgi:hypothetical protein
VTRDRDVKPIKLDLSELRGVLGDVLGDMRRRDSSRARSL